MLSTFLALSLQVAEATTMVPLSVEQITDISNVVVRGVVTEIWTEPDPETKTIWTYAQVEVQEVLKGSPDTQVIVIEQPGGEFGEKKTTVEGVARFSIGEEGYFFVEELASGRLVSTGMFQGKFNIILDPYSQKELAIRFPVHPNRNFDHRFIPLPPEKDRVPVDAFEQRVEHRIKAGWDGKSIPGISREKLEMTNLTDQKIQSKYSKDEVTK